MRCGVETFLTGSNGAAGDPVRQGGQRADIALVGGRVINPESSLDSVLTVTITDGRITSIDDSVPEANEVIDVSGLVVAPGFIDLHSHAQTASGLRLQALDGVTTALDLEGGAVGTGELLDIHADEGRPINFGYSAAWLATRAMVMDLPTVDLSPSLEMDMEHRPDGRWRGPATSPEIELILERLEDELDNGAIGIGALLGYAPDSDRAEYHRLARLAQDRGAPVFTHVRHASMAGPWTSLDSTLEVIAAAAGTGAAMHHCHLNSTSLRQVEYIAEAIAQARAEGNVVTTEAYPYGSGSTVIGAAFLEPELLIRMGLVPQSITPLRTGAPLHTAAELDALRASDPNGLCVVEFLNEEIEDDRRLLLESFRVADTAIASDAVPLVGPDGSRVENVWPIPTGVATHPRSAGCFSKTLRWLVRELGVLTLSEAIRRATLVPAQILESAVPGMRKKGRVQVGCDADLVCFDPRTVADQATYEMLAPSTGFDLVMVNGTKVVADGRLIESASPGRPIRAG